MSGGKATGKATGKAAEEAGQDATGKATVSQVPPPAKDPMTSFRGVMAGALILEAITVGLAVPVVARLGGGVDTVGGWAVIAIAVVLVALCGFLKRPWIVPVILVPQLALVALFVSVPAVGIIGLLFLAFWLWALWLRRDVARRMAEGRLPSQQRPAEPPEPPSPESGR